MLLGVEQETRVDTQEKNTEKMPQNDSYWGFNKDTDCAHMGCMIGCILGIS